METLTPEGIERALRSLIMAERTNIGVEVSTPVAYPGGDLVNVIIEQSPAGFLVHDASFASARLSLAGVTMSRHVVDRLAEYAGRFNCGFENGRVTAKSGEGSIELLIAMVANASRSVADYALELQKHAETDFRKAVAHALRDIIGKRLRENEECVGKSGRKYRVSAMVLDKREASPILFIAPIPNRAAVPHGFAMLYDLKEEETYRNTAREAIYDEASDVRSEDRALLQSACEVITLMQARRRFQKIIGASEAVA